MSRNQKHREAQHDSFERLLTFDEGRRVLGIGARLCWSLVNRGDLPHLRVGRLIKFRRSSLDAWVAEQERKAGGR